MSRAAKFSWKPETPKVVPAGARISAGKSGNVARSLPTIADVLVNCDPVNCMPSPESPVQRMTAESRSTAGRDFVGSGTTSFGAVRIYPPDFRERGTTFVHHLQAGTK